MNRMVRPVMFAFEPDVVNCFGLVSFAASGQPTLNTNYSKGICNFSANVISFTGTTAGSSPTISSVSSFAGLYKGMAVSDGGVNIPAGTTISSMAPGSGTITLNQNANGTNTGLSASGGQYKVTFGSQYSPARFDTYVRLLNMTRCWDESALQGDASAGASAPAASNMFLVANNIANASLANLIIQFGTGDGSSFTALNPAVGEQVRIEFDFTRSTAI